MSERLRIAVISTPRSGNTWYSLLIASVYGIPRMSSHLMEDDAWAGLPEEIVLQIHWPREPEFVDRLRREGFRVVTMARHPIDVLISILHVAVHDVESERWLRGRDGDEQPLWGAWPQSEAFLEYATSKRAETLLSVSPDWWTAEDAVNVRYEDVVADTTEMLQSLEPHFGPLRRSIEAAIEETSMDRMRKNFTNNFFWMGRPGLWRELLTADRAKAIARAHPQVFATLGYEAVGRADLTDSAASRRWIELTGPELGATLRRNTSSFRSQLATMETRAQFALQAAETARSEREALAAKALRLEAELAVAHKQTYVLDEQGTVLHEQVTVLNDEVTALHREATRLQEQVRAAHEREAALNRTILEQSEAIDGLESELGPYRALEGVPMRVAGRIHRLRLRFPGVRRVARSLGWRSAG
jgi:hypothetical protein